MSNTVSHCHKAPIKETTEQRNGEFYSVFTCSQCDKPCDVSHGGDIAKQKKQLAEVRKNEGS